MKPFKKLRMKMIEADADQKFLSQYLCVSQSTISNKLNGVCNFTLEEMYDIMDALNIPYEEMCEYFPREGKSNQKSPAKKRKSA